MIPRSIGLASNSAFRRSKSLLLASARLTLRSTFNWDDGHARSHYSYADGPGTYDADNSSNNKRWAHRDFDHRGFTVGIGGPVGSGKTALTLKLCQMLSKKNINLGVVTNDIFTQEDAEFLVRHQALPADRIKAVETGGCPHAAIREDVSANLTALEQLTKSMRTARKDETAQNNSDECLLICESGGDNLAAHFSSELADLTVYVIDVAGGDKVPRKGGPGMTQADLLVINKIDLAEAVGADLDVMQRDALKLRGPEAPTIFASVKQDVKVPEICDFILDNWKRAHEQQQL